ncbi:MAG TPA: YetF domain-containing protein [Methylomirabilota bacterium]|nr:YetF domain-containing protein [Methylomirabilota bacterium]
MRQAAGRPARRNLRRERPGLRDLRTARRHHGVVSVRDIRYAFLEGDGHVSVVAGRPRRE